MKKNLVKKFAKGTVLIPLGLMMMGNQQCQQTATKSRELRRRVEMGSIQAPSMTLSDGSKFDFKLVANSQMYDVLRKTQSFSTSTMDGNHGLEQMTQSDRDAFNRCDDSILNNEGLNAKVMSKTGQMSTVATCMVNMPQAVIDGAITGFELTNAVGLSVDLLKPVDLGLSVDVKQATLTMAFEANDPFIPGHNLAANTPRAKQQQVSVGAKINFGVFSVGPSAYFKSPLADVVNKAMVNGISDLKTQMDAATPWYTTVMKNCDKAILINAGGAADAGLQVGDVLEVYNVRYQWTGDVCDSTLQSSIPSTPVGQPIAVAQVEIIGDTVSQAKIIEQTAEKIQPGARVYIRKLIQPQPTTASGSQKLATQK